MRKPYAKIAKYLLSVAILVGLVALLIPEKGGLPHPAHPGSVASMKLRRLYLLSTHKSHAGPRIRPLQSLEDLFDIEGFDPALLTTHSHVTGQETRVAHNPLLGAPWQYNDEAILFYFADPIVAYPDDPGAEALLRYFAVTYGGQQLTLAHHPMQQPPPKQARPGEPLKTEDLPQASQPEPAAAGSLQKD